ncbi:glutamate 5-kinase [Ammoniphilus oxalaticus]|uniref:Glutamate 5-kinase n=1 Tax=Ammoniphilus oxalaticus TaxID=66863 RepID=A0A419SF73_9BACL|nr:glutamate 5-kinase [Ammoniphilus oxalaticus]
MQEKKRCRIVVKIGSSSLTEKAGGISLSKLTDHVDALAYMKQLGHEVILVSSGAVAAGFHSLGFAQRPSSMEMIQATAAVGQGLLIYTYSQAFSKFHIPVAQLLLTRRDFSTRQQFTNAHNTLTALLQRGAVPIINENDTVSIDELTFGDNDMLSALVAGAIHADLLIILTDTDGLYNANPRTDPTAKKIPLVEKITPEIEAMASGAGSDVGTGGMRSKVIAAKTALSFGVKVFVGEGVGQEKLYQILEGNGNGTYFGSTELSTMNNKKQWIAFHADVKGCLVVDGGAKMALMEMGKSLLPSGIIEVRGQFAQGDIVEVITAYGDRLGKGVVNYASDLIEQAMGHDSQYAMSLGSGNNRPEIIHRDEWVSYEWRE